MTDRSKRYGPLLPWLSRNLKPVVPSINRVLRLYTRTLRVPSGDRMFYRPWAEEDGIVDEVWREQVYAPVGPPARGEFVVDVGGHIGVFALWAARKVGPPGRVLSFEPDPESGNLFRRNMARNRVTNVDFVSSAVGDRQTEVRFYRDPRWTSANRVATAGLPVLQLTLDDATRNLPRVDYVKIDAEGSELRILQGATALLSKHRPRLSIEVHPRLCPVDSVLRILKDSGYVTESRPAGRNLLVYARPQTG